VLVVIAAAGAITFGVNAEAKSPSSSPSASPGSSPGSSSGSSSSSSAAPGHGWWGPWGGPWPGRGDFAGAPFDMRRALHGEVVVATDDGGTETLLIHRGEVTAVSSSSITVTSTDGFTRSYAVNADTKVGGIRSRIGSVAVGDTVVACAVSGTGGPTARSLIVLAPK
jgi:hypothetical protein